MKYFNHYLKKFVKSLTAGAALLATQPALANDAPAGLTAATPPASSGSHVITWVLIGLMVLGTITILFYVLRKNVSISDKQREERFISYSRELARISATLLAALIALMTFLLIVGVQSRVQGFTTELYTSLVLLGIGIILYAVGSALRELAMKGGKRAVKLFSAARMLQQLVFVGSVVAVIWFVISYAQLIVKPPAAPQPQPQTSQPAEQQPSTQGQPAAEPQPAQPQPGQ